MDRQLPRDEPDGYWTRTTSPDRAFVWVVDADEVKMSHWVMGGSLWQRDPAARLFVAPSGWSFEGRTWVTPSRLELTGRRYPGRLPGVSLVLDVRARTGTFTLEDLAAQQAKGSYLRVSAREVPAAPVGAISFEAASRWLEAFPES